MRHILVVLTIILSVNSVLSQELLITEIDQSSKNIKSNKKLGKELIGISARFGTEQENQTQILEEFTYKEMSKDTLIVEVATVANCCASFIVDLETQKDNKLNLLYTLKNIDCECLKGFYLTYKILGGTLNDEIQLNGKVLKKRELNPNEEQEKIEFWPNGNIKSIKMFLGTEITSESQFDENGIPTKTIRYKDGKPIE